MFSINIIYFFTQYLFKANILNVLHVVIHVVISKKMYYNNIRFMKENL